MSGSEMAQAETDKWVRIEFVDIQSKELKGRESRVLVYSGRSRAQASGFYLLELSVRWYTVVYIPDVYIECLPRVS
jgi:hypothetical protein